jgi:hypothetical protein
MSEPAISTCPFCGAKVVSEEHIDGSFDSIARCANGHEVYLHGTPFVPEHWNDESGPRWWRAVVRWPDREPTSADIVTLRKLSPQLARESVVEVGRKARVDRELEIARDVIGNARNLQEKAREMGIEVELIPISRDEAP